MHTPEPSDLLTPGEVAAMFRVDPRCVNHWTLKGKLTAAVVTPGGHHRYDRAAVEALLYARLQERRTP